MSSDCQYPLLAHRTAYNRGCRCIECVKVYKLQKSKVQKKYGKSIKGKKSRKKCYEKHSVKVRLKQNQYKQKNKHIMIANMARRRAHKKKASVFLTEDEKLKVKEIYKECIRISNDTGIEHHVDHIIPITKGGLHHPDNLQILTAKENLSKGNKIL